MNRFTNGSDAAFEELELRARGTCIRFRNQDLPPGSDPPAGDVGFESDPDSGATRLFVQMGVRYSGGNCEVRQWLAEGRREFQTFQELVSWIRGPLAAAFKSRSDEHEDENSVGQSVRQSSVLTDMTEVRAAVRALNKPLYIAEDKLAARLQAQILGQSCALEALSATMMRHCARLRPARPAVLFAVGSSGVGKTRTAEVLSTVLPDLEPDGVGYQYLRLDMTEYQEAHRVSQLIGAPQGYVGHGEGSQLTDALRANPRTIVLFDEIEKAHPSILRVLMNAMDAGRLSASASSGDSREIDCRCAVFMFTSNLDAKGILDELRARGAFGDRAIEDEVCRRRLHASGIAPEIVGRIGRFLVYRNLEPETRAEILALAIVEVAKEYDVEVNFIEPGVIVEMMRKVQSQGFGVRPERALIDDVLGGLFVQAARDQLTGPVEIVGPPLKCRPHAIPQGQAPAESGSPAPVKRGGNDANS